MSEQEKKTMHLLFAKLKFLCLPCTKQRKEFTEKELFREKWEWRIEQKKRKEDFLTALVTAIKDTTASIKKHTCELKLHEKTEESN